ncbi:MAG: hypothetical protein KGY65_03680 [Candidatus Thermoplasmatota archaeon]|nr:hypothetical protein [Candidatus Thermoplasmatota archaeon]MBS3801830.1 hypothetical protein [Candidatus Thermoplasmatota archaeon]
MLSSVVKNDMPPTFPIVVIITMMILPMASIPKMKLIRKLEKIYCSFTISDIFLTAINCNINPTIDTKNPICGMGAPAKRSTVPIPSIIFASDNDI